MKKNEEKWLNVFEMGVDELVCYIHNNNIKSLVCGISGGLDSAVVWAFVQEAQKYIPYLLTFPVIMPCHSSQQSIDYARLVINKFGGDEKYIDLSSTFTAFNGILTATCTSENQKIREGNLKARLRMCTLYYIANANKGIVMSTDNLSELYMGFWTRHGDEGDYGIIQNIWKGTELYELADVIGVPQEILDAKPDDGLGVTNGGDEEQLGAPYVVVDQIMAHLIMKGYVSDDGKECSYLEEEDFEMLAEDLQIDVNVIEKVYQRCYDTQFKRIGTVNLSRLDLGLGNQLELLLAD